MALTDYGYKRAITIDHLKVDATLTDYPIMVKFDSTNFTFARVRSDGLDVRFTASDETTLLDYEVEYFDATEEKAVYHVRIPSISSSADTSFYMFYGYALESVDGQDVNGVWDSNFVMVQHMGTSLADSTINGNDGTNYGSTVVDGLNGKARSFDGTNDYIEIAAAESLRVSGDFSINTLVQRDDATRTEEYIYNLGYNNTNSMLLILSHDATNVGEFKTSYVGVNMTYPVPGTATLLTIKRTSNVYYLHLNGVYQGSANSNGVNTGLNNHHIGWARPRDKAGTYYKGKVFEMRQLSGSLSDAWIKADDYNLRTYTLLTVGTETANGDTPEPDTGNAMFFGFNF